MIYTTNSIESLNYQMRKVIKTRGQFPNDAAVVKLLWLAICNIEDRRAAERAGRTREEMPDSPGPTRGRTRGHQLEESTGTTRTCLPRPHRTLPLMSPIYNRK